MVGARTKIYSIKTPDWSYSEITQQRKLSTFFAGTVFDL